MLLTACSAHRDKPVVPVKAQPVISIKSATLTEEIQSLRRKKDFKGVIALYEKRKDAFSGADSLKYLSEAYFMEKNYDMAIKTVEELFAGFPRLEDGRLNLMLGVSYYNINLFEAAKRNLIKAEDAGVKSGLLNAYLIEIYLKKGQYSFALNAASQFDGNLKEYLQGVIYFKEGGYRRALEKFDKLGDFKDSRLFKIYCLYYSGSAAALLETAEKGAPKKYPETSVMLAGIHLKNGRVTQAKKLLEDALVMDKAHAAAWKNLGMIYELYLGDKEKARECYNEYLKFMDDDELKSRLESM